jgi:hypothetical protein
MQYGINGSEENKQRTFLSLATFEQKLVYPNVKMMILMDMREDEGGLQLGDSEIQEGGTINCLLGALRHRVI